MPTRTEILLTGIGLGIVAGSLVPWAMLRAVAEILVLLKAQNGKKEIE